MKKTVLTQPQIIDYQRRRHCVTEERDLSNTHATPVFFSNCGTHQLPRACLRLYGA